MDATLFFYGFQNKNSDADWLRIRYFVTFYYFSICNILLDIFPKIKKTKQEWSRFILLKIHQLSVSERRGTFTLKQLYCLQGNRMLIRYDINSIRFYASMIKILVTFNKSIIFWKCQEHVSIKLLNQIESKSNLNTSNKLVCINRQSC